MPGTTWMRLLLLGVCAIFLMGQQPQCDIDPPPSIACSDFSLFVPPGTCVLFDNPCRGDGKWLDSPRQDAFELFEAARPASIHVQRNRAPGVPTTRAICAAEGALVVNESIPFEYVLTGRARGTGHLTLTSSSVLTVAASATPATIDFGQSAQLVATVSGGVPPYSFFWVPPSGLSSTNIPLPVASPGVTTMYNVTVVDSAGQSAHASVTVNVRFQLSVSVNPSSIDAGGLSQLNATGDGGTTPYSFSWAPAASLNDPTISNPIAGPAVTTTYTVTATDALGVQRSGSVTVSVNQPAPSNQADLAVTVVDSPDPVSVNALLTYTITVTNNGPAAATGVALTDALPMQAEGATVAPSQGSCQLERRTRTLTCALGALASGGTATVTIGTLPGVTGLITNTATVGATESDPNPTNNTATQSTTVQ